MIQTQLNNYLDMTMTIYKKSTIQVHKYTVNSLLKCFKVLKINDLNQINNDTGFKIVKYLKENTIKNNASINRDLAYLKKVMHYYEINSTFYKFKNLKAEVKPFKRFYHDDLQTIIRYVQLMNSSDNSLTYKTMIYLLLDSGIRISELINIQIKNVDFTSTPYQILLENTKTGKIRYAPFSDFSKTYIKQLLNKEPIQRKYLFYNFIKDRPLIKNDVKLFYKRLSRQTGIENIHSHRFRKTFASLLIENGMPIDQLQNLFGHSRISTTMIYVQFKESKALTSYNDYNKWHLN